MGRCKFAIYAEHIFWLVLMENYGTALKYAEISANSAGTATEKYDAYLGGVEAHTNSLKAAFESLSTSFIDSDVVTGVLGAGTGILNVLNAIVGNDFVKKIGLLNIALVATAGILGGTLKGSQNALASVFTGWLGKLGPITEGTKKLGGSLAAMAASMVAIIAVSAFNELNVTLAEQQESLAKLQSSYKGVSEEMDLLSGKSAKGGLTSYEQARLDFLAQYKNELMAAVAIQERAVISSEAFGTGQFGASGMLGEAYSLGKTNVTALTNRALSGNNPEKAQPVYEQLMTDQARLVEIQGTLLSDLSNPNVMANPALLAKVGDAYDYVTKQVEEFDVGITAIIASGLVSYTEDVANQADATATAVGGITNTLADVELAVAAVTTKSSALTAALKQQTADGYLSAESMAALAEAGLTYGDAVEEIDGTYRISLETLQESIRTNQEYEFTLLQIKKATALSRLETEKAGDADEDRISSLKAEIASYEELADQIQSAMSALSQYRTATETANASADYDYGTGTVLQTITDGLKNGRIATDDFKKALSFFTDGSFGDAITQEDIPAIEAFMTSIADITQGGAAGLNAATAKFRAAGLLDENGQFVDGATLEMAANALGDKVGTELAYSVLKSYEDYGFDLNLEEIMTPEDYANVATVMGETTKSFIDASVAVAQYESAMHESSLTAADQEAALKERNRVLDSLSSEDIQNSIDQYRALIDTGVYSGEQNIGFQGSIDTLQGLLDKKTQLETEKNAITIEAIDNATPVITAIVEAIPKSVGITINAIPGTGFGGLIPGSGTISGKGGSGTGFGVDPFGAGVSGNANAGGQWGRGSGGKTLVGELGREIVVDPATNRWYTVGNSGAQFVDLPSNAIVFNHLQTQSILAQGKVGERGSALIGGNAALGGVKLTGGISDIKSKTKKPSSPGSAADSAEAVSLSKVYENEIKLLETQIKLTNDLLNMYEEGTANWFSQQQYIIDNYKRQSVLAQAEYARLVASGADINSEDVQKVLQSLVEYKKEVFEASQDYWEAEKDNANSTLEHMKSQAQAVMDLKDSYHDLTKSIQSEQRSIDSELRIASEAYPNLTSSEREAAFSGDDYRQLSNRLAVIAAEAANMQADYMQQIKDVGEESTYELESITDEFQTQYELKLDAYNIAKNELAVLKAKKNLENIQSERSVAMLIGGMWTWVADAENVAEAMRGVTDAQQELSDAQSDATFNAEQANISGVINQIDDQIGAIDALVYSSDALAEEVHSLVATIQTQVLAAMSPSSAAMLASLPMYAGTSTGLFGTSSLQSLLAASLASSGAAFAPMSSLGVDLSSILGNMGSVRPSISVSSSPTGDIVSIGQLTITGAVASQFIALLRSVAPLG